MSKRLLVRVILSIIPWGFEYNENSRRFLEFFGDQIRNPTWKPFIEFHGRAGPSPDSRQRSYWRALIECRDARAISRNIRSCARAHPSTASAVARTTAAAPWKCLAGVGVGRLPGGAGKRSAIVTRSDRSPLRRVRKWKIPVGCRG